ncbi:hypothetical protein LOAG_19133, partial [Loa loa]
AIPMMSEHINHELNRRRGILHYRDGEINPPYLRNALKGIDETNFTGFQACSILCSCQA